MGLSVVAALVVAEVALRFLVADWSWVGMLEFDRPSGACFGLRPGAEVTYEGFWRRVPRSTIAINALGYRDVRRAPTSEPGVPRIALVGDSHVFGLGTEFSQGLPQALERRLGGALGRRVEVLNAGVPGYDVAKELDALPALLQRLHPQHLVFLLDPNDFAIVPCTFWKNRVRPLLQHVYLARGAYMLLGGVSRPTTPSQRALVAGFHAQTRRLQDLLQSLPAAERPSVTFAALGPLPCTADPRQDCAVSLAREGVDLISLAEESQALWSQPERYVITGEGHFNAQGLDRLAARLAEGIIARRFR